MVTVSKWSDHEESKLIARQLALAMAEAHLRSRRDVVVPQYLGRVEFIESLEDTARRRGARFVEVLLDADPAVAAERFRARRNELLARGGDHPQADVPDAAIGSVVSEARTNLGRIAASRGDVVRVRADGAVDETYRELVAALGPVP
jgi:hypothetical protein